MSFKRFDTEDIVISADSVTAPVWTNNVVTLTSFYTSSDQIARPSGDYYWNIYQSVPPSGSEATSAAIQFSISYGDVQGSGSVAFNSSVTSNSPSSVIYKQFRTLVNGTEETNLSFGGVESEYIYAISVERANFKEKLLPGSFELTILTGSDSITLIDDSIYSSTLTFCDSGREYNLISGSIASGRYTGINSNGYTYSSGSFGKLLPDVGVILLSGLALDQPIISGGLNYQTGRASNTAEGNINNFYQTLNNISSSFTLRSEETISSNYVFVRARNGEFNYSTNPSNITGSGELRHSTMIDTPQSYLTAVGLYNDNNDLLAVAKLSRPLLKDFTKEALIRIKLDY